MRPATGSASLGVEVTRLSRNQRALLRRHYLGFVFQGYDLLADAPTGDLGSKLSREILELLVKLNEERGITIAMATHELDMEAYARRLVRSHDGIVVGDERGAMASGAAG